MSNTEFVIAVFLPTWGAVVGFFAYKILGVARKIHELHEIFIPNIGHQLEVFVAYHRDQIQTFHSRLNDIEKEQVVVRSEVMRCCKFLGGKS